MDSTHGSLMAIGELINNAGEFMANRVKEICETLNRFKDFKVHLILCLEGRLGRHLTV